MHRDTVGGIASNQTDYNRNLVIVPFLLHRFQVVTRVELITVARKCRV